MSSSGSFGERHHQINTGRSFPTSARDSMHHGPAAQARVVRGAENETGKSRDLGR